MSNMMSYRVTIRDTTGHIMHDRCEYSFSEVERVVKVAKEFIDRGYILEIRPHAVF